MDFDTDLQLGRCGTVPDLHYKQLFKSAQPPWAPSLCPLLMPHPLDGFQALASIDFITVGLDLKLPLIDSREARALLPQFEGKVCLPARRVESPNESWMTIQDPTKRDIQMLIDHFHDATVKAMEVSIDFSRPGGVGIEESTELYRWLRHCVAPQKHMQMNSVRRRQWNPASHKYERVKGSKLLPNNGTFLWEDAKGWMQTRLYIKDKTAHGAKRVPCRVVRIEATLKNFGGAQNGLVHRVGLIPAFLPELRRYFSPMLSVGKGFQTGKLSIRPNRIKDESRRQVALRRIDVRSADLERRWQAYGAAAGLAKGLAVESDRVANGVIGIALKRLIERIGTLQPPEKVADFEEWRTARLAAYHVFPEGRPVSYRGERPPMS